MALNTAQLLTTSTTLTTSTNNNVSDLALDSRRSLTDFLSEDAFGVEANASLEGFGQKAFGSGSTPAGWGFVKLDLFDNTPERLLRQNRRRRLKMALAVENLSSQAWMYFRSSLNGPWRNVKRGLDFSDPRHVAHYDLIQQVRDEFVQAGLEPRCSKFYQKSNFYKGETAFGLSCVVAELPGAGNYITALIADQCCRMYELTGTTLSPAQRQAGIVATNTRPAARRIWVTDLFASSGDQDATR